MTKEKIIVFLDDFNFNYTVKNNEIIVKLTLAQEVTIKCITNKITIEDKLKAWNFLTGMIEMDLNKALKFNWIGILLLGSYTIVTEYSQYGFKTATLPLFFCTWFIVFANYYHTNLENFKTQLFSNINK